jgi:hypothetical protein
VLQIQGDVFGTALTWNRGSAFSFGPSDFAQPRSNGITPVLYDRAAANVIPPVHGGGFGVGLPEIGAF